MALPSKAEFQALLSSLNNVAKDYDDLNDLDNHHRRMEISAQAKKLIWALTTPEQIPIQHGINMAETIAAHTLMKLKVLEAIPEIGSISLEDLSRVTGVQDSLLERMARPLVATGFLDQFEISKSSSHAPELEYKHTKFSLAYTISSNPQQQETKPGHLFTTLYDQYLKLMIGFADSYLPFVAALERDQNQNQSKNQNRFSSSPQSSSDPLAPTVLEPQDPLHNPYTFAAGQYGKATAWEIMGQNPERLETFQRGLKGLDVMIPPVGHFDFDLLATRDNEKGREDVIEMVDVGGGHGEVLKQILDAHPQLNPERIVLQDREDVVEMVRLGQRNGTGLPRGVRVSVHDFRGVQPIRGAKAYFMRMILHDHCDAVATQILARLAEAMPPDSRVLVCELVLPQRVGEADMGAVVLDQCVMSIGGKERTKEGFRKIFEAAGLELIKVWRVPGVTGGCVEGRLKGFRDGKQQ